jgi:hypothetical protein
MLSFGDRDMSFKKEDDLIDQASKRMEKKQWNRLDKGIQIRKIRNWVEDLSGERYTTDLKEEIQHTLIRAIHKKEINTTDCVEYDTEECKILKIPALMFVEGEKDSDEITKHTRILLKKSGKKAKTKKKKKSS